MLHELLEASYLCPHCGEENDTLIDPSGGAEQSYTEDCSICCRANLIRATISGEGNLSIAVESEE
jgi:hypothetical protein